MAKAIVTRKRVVRRGWTRAASGTGPWSASTRSRTRSRALGSWSSSVGAATAKFGRRRTALQVVPQTKFRRTHDRSSDGR